MSLPSRLTSPTSVIQFLDSPDGKEVVSYFQEMFDKAVKQLREKDEVRLLYYSQGVADASEKLVNLRKDIVRYQDDIRTGKIKLNKGDPK